MSFRLELKFNVQMFKLMVRRTFTFYWKGLPFMLWYLFILRTLMGKVVVRLKRNLVKVFLLDATPVATVTLRQISNKEWAKTQNADLKISCKLRQTNHFCTRNPPGNTQVPKFCQILTFFISRTKLTKTVQTFLIVSRNSAKLQ